MDELLANRARRNRMLAAVVFVVFALVFFLASLARAEDSQDIRGNYHGCKDVTASGGWDTLTSVDLESQTGSAVLSASLYWTELLIKSGSAAVYVCEAAGASCGTGTGNKLSVASGAALTLPLRGMSVQSVAIYATAATTVQVCGYFRKSP